MSDGTKLGPDGDDGSFAAAAVVPSRWDQRPVHPGVVLLLDPDLALQQVDVLPGALQLSVPALRDEHPHARTVAPRSARTPPFPGPLHRQATRPA